MSKKSGNKWKTKKCGRCGKVHSGYLGKLDRNEIEYVVCEITHKKMNVQSVDVYDQIYATIWEMDDG